MKRFLQLAGLTGAALLLSGCGILGGNKDPELEPVELTDFDETLNVRRLWSGKVGKGSKALRLALWPAGDGKRVYTASHDGQVTAWEPRTGKRAWRTDLRLALTAGPGIADELLLVGGRDGHLVALNTEDGSERWRIDIKGEVLAPPLVKDDLLIVYTIDGRLHVRSVFDGSERWTIEQALPPLTLRGAASPALVGNTVVAGFDNGRLLAVSLEDGVTEWETVLSPPTGKSDLERLADVDGIITAVGQDIYASGYNGRIAAVAAESGQVLWSIELSTYVGVTADWNNIYTTTDRGEIVALSRRAGNEQWRSEVVLRRDPTVPVPFDRAVAVGDFEGYVHFLSNLDGKMVARRRVGDGLISGRPVVLNGILFVQNEDGTIAAFEVPRDTSAVSGDEG